LSTILRRGGTMNHRKILSAVLLAVTTGVYGCPSTDPTSPSPDQLSGTYDYTAYDLNDEPVASGTITLSFDGTSVTGQRNIKGDAPEAGTGACTGQQRSDGSIEIDLNPDNIPTVIVEGTFDGSTMKGKRFIDTGGPVVNKLIGTCAITLSSGGMK
jgi:hypothetical protein